ncbi:hypothetical protein V8F63_02550 [Brevundimonas sp. LF-1]|uniref:hypothetical protein n=1 Tax=Brevundimonas sp. LF-1 TaxID=3126100 RepID=UPI0030E15FF9
MTVTARSMNSDRPAAPPPLRAARPRLGDLLVERGLVRPADVANALSLQAQNGGLLGLNLVRLGALSEAQLLDVLSEQLNLPVLAPEHGPAPERVRAFMDQIGSPSPGGPSARPSPGVKRRPPTTPPPPAAFCARRSSRWTPPWPNASPSRALSPSPSSWPLAP